MRQIFALAFSAAALLSSPIAAHAALNVVASIKPIHSLAAAIMDGAGTPHLLVRGGGSPHTFSLKPSDASALQQADVVIWVGEGMETFLTAPLKALAGDATVRALEDVDGLTRLALREGGSFDEHDHEEHDEHDEHDDHDEHEHAHDAYDTHLWLDPDNAKLMTADIAKLFAELDPENAALYHANAKALIAEIDALSIEVAASLAPLKNQPFIVFHDAYQYFETHFDLTAAGSITVSPDTLPGAQRIAEIREKILRIGAVCVFAEPQFEPKLVQTVTEGTAAKSGVLDPLGAGLSDGPDLYPALIRNMAAAFVACLSA